MQGATKLFIGHETYEKLIFEIAMKYLSNLHTLKVNLSFELIFKHAYIFIICY
jgi:hypothetical protein